MWACKLSHLFLVNMLAFGLEICMSTGTIYIPPMLLEAGMQERFMTMVFAVGPVLGLIFVPPLGSASDRWSSRYGRRRPFIWALCVGVLLGLVVISQHSQIAGLLSKQHQSELDVLLLVCGICLQEFCGQACFTPLEALVSDLFPGEDNSRRAFSIYSLMIGLGGCVGYLLPAIDWSILRATAYLGGQEAFIYTVLTLLLFLCLTTTAFIPEQQTNGAAAETSRVSWCTWSGRVFFRTQILKSALVSLLTVVPRLYSLCRHMPKVTSRLFVAKLCSWMALNTFVLFYTDFVGEELYRGVPSAKLGSPERLRYEEGVRVASVGLFLQCVTSVGFSLLMDRMVARVGARTIYLSSVTLLALSTAAMTVSRNIVLVTVMATVTGYTCSALQILPFTLTCLYHSDKQVFFSSTKLPFSKGDPDVAKSSQTQSTSTYRSSKGSVSGHPDKKPSPTTSSSLHSNMALPVDVSVGCPLTRGMCLDIAILDSAYMLSQVAPSLFLGSIVQLFRSMTTYMFCASGLGLLAVYFSSRIVFDSRDMEALK